jgi:hypothetical protein
MSQFNRKFVFAYVVLVALPLVALAGILRSGRTLTAPPSVDGIWSLQIDSTQLDSLPCGKTLAATPDKSIAISQSGKTFVLSFANGPKALGSGTVEGTSLHASLTPSTDWSAENGCGSGRSLTLLATVDKATTPRSLAGMLAVGNCPTCRTVEFHAVEQNAPPSKGGH